MATLYGSDLIGQRLEVERGCGDGLALAILGVGRIVSMGKMAAAGQIETHHAVVRAKDRGVHGKVGRAATVRLHIHAPGLGVQLESAQRTLAAEIFSLHK